MRRSTASAAAALVGGALALTALQRTRAAYERRIDDLAGRVLSDELETAAVVVTEDDLAGLPEPVRRWLGYAGVVGRPLPRTVRVRQVGELRIGGGNWLPFTAEEYYSTSPPAFVWKARIRMAPGVEVIGADSYVEGEGRLEMRLLGVVPVARDLGPTVDEADLLRFLNEVMWFPAAALIPEITWEPVDADELDDLLTPQDERGHEGADEPLPCAQ